MAVIRFSDPFRELSLLQDRMNRIFDETVARSGGRREEEVFTGSWAPPVDIVETKEKLVLTAELPGLTEDQIHLRVEDAVLSLEGERAFQKEAGDASYHRVERSYGKFFRSFTLPTHVDTGRISASFSNGVLTVELPKREETKPKTIKIGVGGPIDVKSA